MDFKTFMSVQQCDRIVRLDLIKEINGGLIRPIKYTKVLKYKIF